MWTCSTLAVAGWPGPLVLKKKNTRCHRLSVNACSCRRHVRQHRTHCWSQMASVVASRSPKIRIGAPCISPRFSVIALNHILERLPADESFDLLGDQVKGPRHVKGA